jgi:RNA polymerase sigma factor (sigma-70 family)
MTTWTRTAMAQPDPARSPAAVAQLPTQHRRGGHASHGSRAITPTGANSARGDPMVIDLAARARHGEQQAWDTLVERYSPLIWSICRRHRLSDADADDVGQSVWLLLVQQLDRIHDQAALPGWLATVTRRECMRVLQVTGGPLVAEYVQDADSLPDKEARTAEQELLAAERHAALREAFLDLPPSDQRLIGLLIEDPPVPYAQISARLGIPVGSIGPTRHRCLDKLRRHLAIAALINPGNSTA